MKFVTILVLFIVLSGCTQSESSEDSSKKKELSREELPHYFKDFARVDGPKDPGYVYRMENEEIICYSRRESMFCHWKQQDGVVK